MPSNGIRDDRKKINYIDQLNAEKFDYIVTKYIDNSVTRVANAFGYRTASQISAFRKNKSNNRLSKLHLDALEKYFDIPVEVFNNNISIDKIDDIINKYRDEKLDKQTGQDRLNNTLNNMFNNTNEIVFQKLQGKFYAHIYPANKYGASIKDGVSITETTINDDYSVIDKYGDKGILRIGQYQSFIFKISLDERDINVIRFYNRDVIYGDFRYVILSNQHGTTNEIVNFGFYSRKKHTPKEVKRILGDDISKLQLKLDLEFNDRIG